MNISEPLNDNINIDLNNNNDNSNDSQSFINLSLPIPNTRKEEEQDKNNNYYYNDQVNSTYKPAIPKKEENTKNHNNKLFSCEKITSTKIIKSAKKLNRPRENYNPIEGDILKEKSELDFICKRIHGNKYKIYFNLLYRASEDKDKSSIFHRKCDHSQTTLVLIGTKNGLRFGGYTKRTWRGKGINKIDNDAFIFSLNKKKIYNNIRGKNAIECHSDYGPSFSGGFMVNDNAFTNGGKTFSKGLNFETNQDYELTNGIETFTIKEIEVYEIKIA